MFLPPATKRIELISPDQSEDLGDATAPIASNVEGSEEPKALSESHRSLPQGALQPYLIFSIIRKKQFFRTIRAGRKQTPKGGFAGLNSNLFLLLKFFPTVTKKVYQFMYFDLKYPNQIQIFVDGNRKLKIQELNWFLLTEIYIRFRFCRSNYTR